VPIEFNKEGWNNLVKDVVDNECVPRMQNVADACNEQMAERSDRGLNEPGYVVSVVGGKPLEEHDYRATVITGTNQAMFDNAENNTLLQNFYLGAEKSQ
jgi:hypothetical protein